MARLSSKRSRSCSGTARAPSTSSTCEIDDGEFMVFVGPSGCGKTTALRMVAGLEDISGGVVRIGERVVNDLSPKSRDIAMVFQSYALYPHLSVRDNIAFPLKIAKVPKDEIRRRVDEAARILDLEPYLERKPRALSGGQRQRVAMGRAIVREPAVFLLDEPLSNLDAKLRVQMRADIKKIQHDLGTTTIYVTHDQVEAMTMGDRVAVMRKGELQQVAPPQELYDRPVNIFVAGFIGSPAMNMLEARSSEATVASPSSSATSRLEVDELAARRSSSSAGRSCVGIRPENLEDAALANGAPGGRLRGACRVARGARGGGARPLHDRRAAGSHRRHARAGRGRRRRPRRRAARGRRSAGRDARRPVQPAHDGVRRATTSTSRSTCRRSTSSTRRPGSRSASAVGPGREPCAVTAGHRRVFAKEPFRLQLDPQIRRDRLAVQRRVPLDLLRRPRPDADADDGRVGEREGDRRRGQRRPWRSQTAAIARARRTISGGASP